MTVEYEASVFFGAAVPRTTPLGKLLDTYIDQAGGTPASTEEPGVVVSMVGSQSTREVWMVVEAKGLGHSCGRNQELQDPVLLEEYPLSRAAIASFFERLGASSIW